MRSATVIVGAIAASSVLIALAFILSDGSGSGQPVTTRTVTEIVKAPPQRTETVEPSTGETGVAQAGGPTACNGGEFAVEDVPCEAGAQIHEAYEEGGRGELFAEDKEGGETITMSCSGTAPVECTGPGGARVYFGK